MARISTYGNDTDIQAEDRWIGTSSLDGSTINFTAQELGYFYSLSGLADAGKLTFSYTYVGQYVDGSSDLSVGGNLFYGGFSVPEPADLTNVYISRFTLHNVDIQPITQVLLDDVIKITSLDSPEDTKYGIYDVTAVTDVLDNEGNVIGYDLTVAIKIKGLVPATSGNLGVGVVNITPLGDSSTSARNANPVTALEFFVDPTTVPVDFKLRATLLDGTIVESNALNSLGFGRLLNGTANPNGLIQGYPGDFFIDTTNQNIYGPLASTGSNWGLATSIQGMDGTDGADGESGISGAQGEQGIQGVQGEQGIQGVQGDKGDTGAAGATGAQGLFDIEIYRIDTVEPVQPSGGSYDVTTNTLTPPVGWVVDPSTPAAGQTLYESRAQIIPAQGDVQTPDWSRVFQAGSQGPTGNTGVGIVSATVVNGMLTFVLTTGATLGPFNVQGPKGDTGNQGIQGIQGIQGVQGNTGDKGDQGDQGIRGNDGEPVSTATGVVDGAGNTTVTFGTASNANIGEVLVNRGQTGAQGPAGTAGNIAIEKDGTAVVSAATALNFTGTNVVVGNTGTVANVSVTEGVTTVSNQGVANSSINIIDFEGTAVDSVNFTGNTATVTINDNAYTFTDTTNTGKTALGVDFTTVAGGTHDFTITGVVDSSALVVTPNPSGAIDAGDLTKITIDGSIFGIPSGGINTIFTVITVTPQDVPNGTIAIVSATMQFYNVSGVTQTGVTTSTDFTASPWLGVGEAAAGIDTVLGTPGEVLVQGTVSGTVVVGLSPAITTPIDDNTAARISNLNTAISTTDLTSLTVGATSFRIRNGHEIVATNVIHGGIARLDALTIDGVNHDVSAVFGNVPSAVVNNGNLTTLTIDNEVYSIGVPAAGSTVTVGTRTVGTATAVDSITIDGTTSNVSDIFVNPAGTPSNAIVSLEIDGTHYSIAGTGGGSTVSVQSATSSDGLSTAVTSIDIDGTMSNISDVFPNVGINNLDTDLFSLEIDGNKYQIVTVVPTQDTVHNLLDSLEINGITNDVTVVVADTSLIGAHTPLRTVHINGADFTLLRPNDGQTANRTPLLNVVDGEDTYTVPQINTAATAITEKLERIVLDGTTYNVDAGVGTIQNLFQRVASGTNDVIVAETATDILNIEAGANVSITTDATSDTLTINAVNTGSVITQINNSSSATALRSLTIDGVAYIIQGGTPVTPTAPSGLVEDSSGFNTDRFDLQTDEYTVTGSWVLNGATIPGLTVVLSNGTDTENIAVLSTDTSFSYNITSTSAFATGSQNLSYSFDYTESDGTTTGTVTSGVISLVLNKSLPGNPSLNVANTGFLLGATNNQIEQADAGTLNATGSNGALNGWEVQTPLAILPATTVAVAATDDFDYTFTASTIYRSPAGANSVERSVTRTAVPVTITKIRSVRWGQSMSPTIDQAFIDDFATNWNGGASSTTMQIDKGTVDPNGFDFDIVINVGGNVMYFVYDANQADLRSILISGINTLSGWTITTVGNYKVYLLDSPQAPNFSYDITLTT